MLRFLENFFYTIASWFEDWADSIDKDFHDNLRLAMAIKEAGYNAIISGNVLKSHKDGDITTINEFKLHSASIFHKESHYRVYIAISRLK